MHHKRILLSRSILASAIILQPLLVVIMTILGPAPVAAQTTPDPNGNPSITQAQAANNYLDSQGSSLLPSSAQPADQTEIANSSDDADVKSFTPNYTPNSLSQIQSAFFGGDFTLPTATNNNSKPTVPTAILNTPPVVQISADDVTKLNDYQVDTRITQYLNYLAAPAPLGAGLAPIKANVYKGYDTSGIGKYDRQTLAANLESPTQISPHNSGQAVDITSAGTITCKLVEHRIIGGHTTHWQPAMPVKIAWQSPNGIANNPVPTGDSMVGTAGTMSASGIVSYLNSTGQMDAYIDYAKGLDFGTIAQYVGGNILLKGLGTAQVQMDPLAGSVLSALGSAALTNQLPGLPVSLNAETGSDDIRISAAKAQIEDGLGLPAGSLSTLGWNNILLNTGKRLLEQDLGLPTNYLNSHDLPALNSSNAGKGGFSFVSNNDSAFNFLPNTVATLQKNDPKGLEMAAVNVVAKAFKLSDAQKTQVTTAISKNQTPKLDASGLNTGGQLSVDGLTSLLSANSSDQQTALSELKTTGLAIFQKAITNAVPSQYSGLTQQLINSLLNPNTPINLNDVSNTLGLHSLFTAAGVDPTQVSSFLNNPQTAGSAIISSTVASGLNELFGLKGGTVLTSGDITSMLGNNLDSLKKIGGGEIDRAFNWAPGTGLGVISDPAKLAEAMKQTFANGVAGLLGLTSTNFSLSGNTSQDYGLSLILQRFGLSGFTGSTSAADLLTQVGAGKFSDLFGLSNLNPSSWADAALNGIWTQDDINLGVPTGTIKNFLQGQTSGQSLIQLTGNTNVDALNPDQLWEQFDINGVFVPDTGNTGAQKTDMTTIANYLKTGQGASQAIALATKIIGRSVESHGDFSVDDFNKFLSAGTDQGRTSALLDAGLKILGRSMGANLSSYTDQQIDGLMSQVKNIFNHGTDVLDPRNPLFKDIGAPLIDFFVKATGVPKEFTQDAVTFLTGDYRTGLSALSFILWQKDINPYLPASDQLTYQELRDTLGISDPASIQKEVDKLTTTTDANGNPISVAPTPADYDMARQELNKQATQTVQYKMSDSFLRKIDPNIPVGFTKAMFTGSDKDRAQMLQDFAFNNLDNILKKINPAYVPGTLEGLFTGKIDASQAVLSLVGTKDPATALQGIIAHSGLSLGPLNSNDLGGLINYFAFPKANQNILTDVQFAGTWSNLDKWLSTTIGIGALPAGIGRSIFYASQNGWNFDASLKNAAGVTVIASVNSLATDFATSKLTGWADKQLHMPAGTMYQIYTAAKAVITASQTLALAHAAGDAVKIASASKGLSTAQASLTVLAITTALQMCAACQAFFSSVDAALHAPPGFTNAAVAGAIAAAFHLGYFGLYVAAAIYLFGVNSTSYECPKPPVDQYAITTFDQGNDVLSYGYTPGVDGPSPPNPNPAPGQNPFTWGDSVPFTNANNQTWEGWARYFTGKVLQATLNYGKAQVDLNKPLQILTYRQANVEYFAPQAAAAFGTAEAGNNKVGMGFTQSSTKTTNYVYVTFGGYF